MLKIREHIKIHVGFKNEDKLPAVKKGKKQKSQGKTEASPAEIGGMSRGTAVTVLGLWRSRRQEEAEENEEVQEAELQTNLCEDFNFTIMEKVESTI